MYPQKSPKSLHFASISPPNIPQRLHFASMYPQKSHLYPIARGVARTQEHAGTHEGARYIHIHSTLHSKIPTAPAFCKHISSKHPNSACILQAYLLQTSPQRLHFASMYPQSWHLYPIARGLARTHTQAHTKEHAISTLLSTLPFGKGSIQT